MSIKTYICWNNRHVWPKQYDLKQKQGKQLERLVCYYFNFLHTDAAITAQDNANSCAMMTALWLQYNDFFSLYNRLADYVSSGQYIFPHKQQKIIAYLIKTNISTYTSRIQMNTTTLSALSLTLLLITTCKY